MKLEISFKPIPPPPLNKQLLLVLKLYTVFFQFLNGIKEIAIIADNDTPRPVGYRAAYDLAMRAIKQGIKASIWQSKTPGYDALDELNEKKQSDNHFGGQTA